MLAQAVHINVYEHEHVDVHVDVVVNVLVDVTGFLQNNVSGRDGPLKMLTRIFCFNRLHLGD